MTNEILDEELLDKLAKSAIDIVCETIPKALLGIRDELAESEEDN